jgi:hypothetical protein
MTTRKKTTKRAAQAASSEIPAAANYRPWWQGQRRSRRRATAFDTFAAAALTGLLVRESAETTLSELVEGALHLATLMEAAKEERGK